MKKSLLLLILIFLRYTLSAQNCVFAKGIGGLNGDKGNSITVDALGNVYTTGLFNGIVDFDPGVGTFTLNSSADNIFISKFNSAGNFVWAKSFASAGSGGGNGIALDASGNIYTTGYFNGTTDFDPGAGAFTITSAGSADIFISKLDAAGNFVWVKSIGGVYNDHANAISLDAASGYIYTTGTYSGNVDFDPGPATFTLSANGQQGIFISKLDASGNFVWAKSVGGSPYDNGNSIALDATGNIYTTGYFGFSSDFDPGPSSFNLTSLGVGDVFILKLDAIGNFVWAKQMGGSGPENSFGITIDPAGSGAVYTTGYFGGSADFDPGAGTFNLNGAGNLNIFISKLDAAGNFIWAKGLGNGSLADQGNSVALDASGNIYTTGHFSSIGDFDPGAGTYTLDYTSGTLFILKLNSSGSFVWAVNVPGFGIAITLDASASIYLTGYFYSPGGDFDPGPVVQNLNSSGVSDIVIAKYNDLATRTNEFKNDNLLVNIYPNPTNSKLFIEADDLNKITISNCLGQTIFILNLPAVQAGNSTAKQEIDLSSFESGIYFLNIQSKIHQKNIKIIKE